jgi:antitoxin HicB
VKSLRTAFRMRSPRGDGQDQHLAVSYARPPFFVILSGRALRGSRRIPDFARRGQPRVSASCVKILGRHRDRRRFGYNLVRELKMRAYDFKVLLEPDQAGGYVVSCPGLPGCYSQGESVAEAMSNIKEAIELTLEDMLARGEDVPDSSGILVGSVVVKYE